MKFGASREARAERAVIPGFELMFDLSHGVVRDTNGDGLVDRMPPAWLRRRTTEEDQTRQM